MCIPVREWYGALPLPGWEPAVARCSGLRALAGAAMMVCMPLWVTSVLVSVGVSVATVLVVGLTVGPRLAARGKRIQAAHDSRDRFSDSVLDLLVLCGNLERVAIPAEVTDPVRSRLQGERDRWLGQINEITIWLVDNWQQVALSFAGRMGLRDLVTRYMAGARGLWLSDRPLEDRVRLLRELTEPVQTIFFARRWRVVSSVPGEMARLRTMLDILDGGAPPQSSSAQEE